MTVGLLFQRNRMFNTKTTTILLVSVVEKYINIMSQGPFIGDILKNKKVANSSLNYANK